MSTAPIKSSSPSVAPGQLIKACVGDAVLPNGPLLQASSHAASAGAPLRPAATPQKPQQLDINPTTAVDTADTADRIPSSTSSGSSPSCIVRASCKTSSSSTRHLHSNSSDRNSSICAGDSHNMQISLHQSSSKHVGVLTTAALSCLTEPPQSALMSKPQGVKAEGRALHSSPVPDDRLNKATEGLYSGLQTLLRTHQSTVFLQTVQVIPKPLGAGRCACL